MINRGNYTKNRVNMLKNLPATPEVFDMYNMVGFCPPAILKGQAHFALRNLVDASDNEALGLQKQLVDFLVQEVFKLPKEKTTGLILHSGTEANETALLLAKRQTKRNLVLASNISHSSVENACDKLNMNLLKLCVEPQNSFKVNETKLKDILTRLGDEIAVINITYGTTKLGTGEDFALSLEIEKICREKGIWVHIDAAYGGLIMNLIESSDNMWQKSDIVRSITVDPHKFIGALGCGVLLLTHPKDEALIGPEVIYFHGHTTALGTTRSTFPVATAVATINLLGLSGLKKLAINCHKKAKTVANKLEQAGLSLIVPIQSGVVPIATKSENDSRYVQVELLKQGFKVSPIKISNDNYQLNGIRIVVTPKPIMSSKNLKCFTEKLINIFSGLRQGQTLP